MAERALRRRAAAPDEAALWQQAMRDVAPLGDRLPAAPAPRPAPPALREPPRSAPPPEPVPAVLPPLDRFAGLDRATAERLKRGRLAVEARLDLHGITQDEAYRALAGFVGQSRRNGLRCLLVITGRGAGGGVLRAAVPRWLAEPALRHHLLAIAPAQPRDGGGGALYLLTRRADRGRAPR